MRANSLSKTPLRYQLPNDRGIVTLSPTVLSHLAAHQQVRWLSREAGGQLFATLEQSTVAVTDITGPRLGDRRSLYNYEPDRAAERIEIAEHYERGLHFVGDWHTHKQRFPQPSDTDLQNIRALVQQSKHDLAGFLLIVVGQAEFPKGLHVSFHTTATSTVLGADV